MLFTLMLMRNFFAGPKERCPEVEIFIPSAEDRYFSGSPTKLRPSQILSAGYGLRPSVGTSEERAVIATFVRVCADIDDSWYGISLRAFIKRLNNEADRVEAGQIAIHETAVTYNTLLCNKRRKRFRAYRKGVDACLARGLLRCEKLDGVDVISALPAFIEALRLPAEKAVA